MNPRIDKLLIINAQNSSAFTLFALAKEYENAQATEIALSYYQKIEMNFENYTGFYYHYAQLLFNLNLVAEFKEVVSKGIKICSEQNEKHDLAELRGLLNECIDDE